MQLFARSPYCHPPHPNPGGPARRCFCDADQVCGAALQPGGSDAGGQRAGLAYGRRWPRLATCSTMQVLSCPVPIQRFLPWSRRAPDVKISNTTRHFVIAEDILSLPCQLQHRWHKTYGASIQRWYGFCLHLRHNDRTQHREPVRRHRKGETS